MMKEKFKWAMEYEKIRHKHVPGALLMEISSALFMIVFGIVAWALLMTFPAMAVYIREKTHADFIVPKSDKDIKQEALAQSLLIWIRYMIYSALSVIVMYVGYVNNLLYFRSFTFPKYMIEHPLSMALFMLLGAVFVLLACVDFGFSTLARKKKSDTTDIIMTAFYFAGFGVYFLNGMYIQGFKWASLGIKFGGMAGNILLVVASVLLIIKLIYSVIKFEPGDFSGNPEEMLKNAKAKQRRTA